MINECPKCAEFDAVTKAKMQELFGREEIFIMATGLGNYIVTMNKFSQMPAVKTEQRFVARRNIDIATRTMGKFIIALEEKDQGPLKDALRKSANLQFNVQHESCPHKEEPNEPNPAA